MQNSMTEAPRIRPVESFNPRPYLLGLCFLWGIGVGFCLFYFSPPKQIAGKVEAPPPEQPQVASKPRIRDEDVPATTVIPDAPTAEPARPRLENMQIESPAPILTTEGGLSGRTAAPLTVKPQRPSAPQTPVRTRPPPPMQQPPPIPELMP